MASGSLRVRAHPASGVELEGVRAPDFGVRVQGHGVDLDGEGGFEGYLDQGGTREGDGLVDGGLAQQQRYGRVEAEGFKLGRWEDVSIFSRAGFVT